MEGVGRLAGGVAHDFNNLLMVIGGYAQLLGETSTDAMKVSQYATQIAAASSKAATITRQLLAFSRKGAVEPTVLDLGYIVKDLGKMLPRLLGEDVELVMALEPQLGTVRADRGQIEQVIMNLAVNARDAMPQGGRLTIETSNVELDTAYHQRREVSVPPGRYVLLTLGDTGVGMSAETQLHIFEPFFTTKEAGKGTGLGLATVYGIVKQSQGFIWVYSELGKGSTFKIYLPRLDAAASEQISPSTQATPVGTETILLVEDEAALRNVTRVYLESKGYTVLEAANAKEALDLCQGYQRPIQALIADMVMPGLGGLELAKAAAKLRPGLAVVLVSGYTDRAIDTDAASIGARFLSKPFSLDALARTVRSSLAKNRRILLVEHSKFLRVAVTKALTRAGYTVSTANNGEEGVRAARESVPDLILLDMTLPRLSGPEVLHALKKDPTTKNVPVIILTALSEKERGKFLAEGAAACLGKSTELFEKDSAVLIEAVVRVLGEKPAPNG
jgi:CheY-like chemotaxis protein